MLQAYSDSQARGDDGRWSGGVSEAAKAAAEKVSSLLGKIGRALQGDWRSESTDRESTGLATKQIEQKSYTHHMALVRGQLEAMGVKDLWSTDLHASPDLRREALRSPGTFDRKLDHIEAELKQARSFADSHEPDGSGHSTADLIDAKLVQIGALRDAVEKFRDKQASKEKSFPPFAGPGPAPPDKPKPPTVADVAKRAETADVANTVKDAGKAGSQGDGDLVYPSHYRTKGAAKINVQTAFDHLAKGNTVKSAVEHVMASGGLKRATAQRYVRAAVKEAAASADRNVIRLKEEVARAKSRRA